MYGDLQLSRKIEATPILKKKRASLSQHLPPIISPHLKRNRQYSVQSFELLEDGRILQEVSQSALQVDTMNNQNLIGPAIYIKQSLKGMR